MVLRGNEAGQVEIGQRVRSTEKALREVFGEMPRSRFALKMGPIGLDQSLAQPVGIRSDRGSKLSCRSVKSVATQIQRASIVGAASGLALKENRVLKQAVNGLQPKHLWGSGGQIVLPVLVFWTGKGPPATQVIRIRRYFFRAAIALLINEATSSL